MFGFRLDQAKGMFFDRKAVTSRLSRAKRKVFNRTGGLTRKIARNSMKPVSKRILKQISNLRQEAAILVHRRQSPSVQARRRQIILEIRALQKQAASKPGKPPKTIVGTIKKQLLYGYDPATESVVIGPILFAPTSGAPETLEFGGSVQIGPRHVSIAKRPYMGPAREKVQPQVAGFFRDSL